MVDLKEVAKDLYNTLKFVLNKIDYAIDELQALDLSYLSEIDSACLDVFQEVFEKLGKYETIFNEVENEENGS